MLEWHKSEFGAGLHWAKMVGQALWEVAGVPPGPVKSKYLLTLGAPRRGDHIPNRIVVGKFDTAYEAKSLAQRLQMVLDGVTGEEMAIWDRFWSKVDKNAESGCWLWTGAKNGEGYGQFTVGRKSTGAHRVSWEYTKGPVPNGLHLDHLCRVHHCVNPDHLEPVTQSVNARRGARWERIDGVYVRCSRGHDLTGPDGATRKDGHVVCRACKREAYRRTVEKRRNANV